ncbi:ADP-dependent glucokinase-like isoform X1 [Argonauta hians]
MLGKVCLLSVLIALLAAISTTFLGLNTPTQISSSLLSVFRKSLDLVGSKTTEDFSDEQSIITAWGNFIKAPPHRFKRVSVGINSCLDMIIEGIPFLQDLQIKPSSSIHDHSMIGSTDQLQETFSHYFQKGSAAERTVGNSDLFQKMVAVAQSQPNVQKYLGGNALLMANKIASNFPDAKVQYVGPVGPDVRDSMPQNIDVPKESLLRSDDVHLILEYKSGDVWGPHTSSVANRFILNNNIDNFGPVFLKAFFNSLEVYRPDLIVFSGLHTFSALESDPEVSEKKVLDIAVHFQMIPISVPVHLELASMTDPNFVRSLLHRLLPLVSSLGLNEVELAQLSHLGNGPHTKHGPSLAPTDSSSVFGANQPEIYKVSDTILWLLKNFGFSKKHFSASRLTRVHFHSLTYHIVGVLPSAWKNSESAVAAGTQIAGRQACNTDQLRSADVKLKIPKMFRLHSRAEPRPLNEKRPVISWEMEGYHFVFSPVLVCQHPQRTVGLGDAISSTGLMYSNFDAKYRR